MEAQEWTMFDPLHRVVAVEALAAATRSTPRVLVTACDDSSTLTLTNLEVHCISGSAPNNVVGVTAHFGVPQRAPPFGLIVVTSRYLHAQLAPAASLHRLSTRLADDGKMIIIADGAVGMHGLAHVRRALAIHGQRRRHRLAAR